MATNRTAKGNIVIQYLESNPTMPSLTMAKLIMSKHPLEFKDTEAIRTLIRVYRGASGDKMRLDMDTKDYYDQNKNKNFLLSIPEPESEDIKPYKLPLINNNIGVFGDFHIPHHRKKPIELAVNYFKEQNVNTLILNGDILDNTPFTRHDGKRPSAADVRKWFDQAEYFFEYLRNEFPDAMIIWLEGNHDYWYRRWMNQHAALLDADPYFSLQERLHIDEYKIKFIDQTQYLMAGKLSVCHGHQLGGKFGVGVMPARTVYLKTKRSMVINHVHVETSYTEPDLHGDIVTCWSIACMCTLTPEYQPFGGKACHGFGHVKVEKGGDFNMKNFRVHKNKIL